MRVLSPPHRTVLVIAAREVYDRLHNPLVSFLILTAAILSAFTTHVGIARVDVGRFQERELLHQRELDRSKSGGRAFGTQAETGLRVIRPPEPLSVLASGVDGIMPRSWDFSPSGVRTGRALGELGNERSGASGNVDLEFLIRLLGGLLAISIAVETIASERASGALYALLGQPIQPRHVLAGKLLGGTATLATAIGVIGAVALATTAVDDPRLLSLSYVVSMLMLCMAGTLYAFVIFAGGIFISIAFATSSALTATFVAWTILSLIALPAAGVVAQAVVPIRPRPVVETERERLVEAATAEVQKRMGDEYVNVLGGREAWAAHQQDRELTKAAEARAQPIWNEYVKTMRARLDAAQAATEASAIRQRRVSLLLALPNPAADFAEAATNLTASGDRTVQRWDAATAAYQRDLDRHLFDDRPNLYALAPYVNSRQPDTEHRLVVLLDRHAAPTFGEVPSFVPPARHFTQRVRDALPYLTALTVYACALVGASLVAFGRLRF